ncbi:MAG: hypothetical protein ACKO5C_00440 [Ferruginibacter sp.]
MRLISFFSLTFLFTIIVLIACKKDNSPADPCTGVTISVNTTTVTPGNGLSNGSITVNASPAGTYTYSLNSGGFQSSNQFTNLAAGSYTVIAKNANGCSSASTAVTLAGPNPCGGTNIVLNATPTASIPCTPFNGSILASATGSNGFTYNLNGGVYQSSGTFSGLQPGSYVVGVKDANGCTKTQSVTVGNKPRGTKFELVRLLISAKCANCHMGNSSDGGVSFNDECNIITKKDRINQRCVVQSDMPPGNPLTTAQKAQITDWINAGGRYTD